MQNWGPDRIDGSDMKLKTIILAAALMTGAASADRIVLSDGSAIQGKVLSMNNGVYQIQTDALGVVSLPQSKVNSISSGSALPQSDEAPVDSQSASAIQSLQSSMASNPGIMSHISYLQNDPDMKAVLQDPEVMRAVQSFDLQALSNNPKIKKLMQNQKIQEIRNKIN